MHADVTPTFEAQLLEHHSGRAHEALAMMTADIGM